MFGIWPVRMCIMSFHLKISKATISFKAVEDAVVVFHLENTNKDEINESCLFI